MKTEDIEHMMRQTLEDYRLSRGEKRALKEALGKVIAGDRDVDLYRNSAFRMAREHFNDAAASAVMDWLEDVIKILQSPAMHDSTRADSHFSPGDDCPARIAGLFTSAQQSADVCVFTITDDRITRAMLTAHERGVKIRVITDNEKAFDPGSDISRLESAGIDVRVDRSPYHMHHKFALFDEELLLTGSYNWTRGAAEKNQENFVVTDETRLLGPFSEIFERLWKQFQ